MNKTLVDKISEALIVNVQQTKTWVTNVINSKFSTVVGDASTLQTTNKTNIVNAINEVNTNTNRKTAIDDVTPATTTTFSSTSIINRLNTIIGGADTNNNTLAKLATRIDGKENTITAGTATQFWAGNKTWKSYANIALSGSFNDITNPSQIYTVVNSSYVVGIDSAITADDTLNQQLGKLQGQITQVKSDILGKEPTIAAGISGQYWDGTKTWKALPPTLTNWQESINTTTPNNTTYVVILSPAASVSATNVDLVLSPKGNGALMVDLPDNAAAGGNKRGQYAIDFQLSRTASTQVASGNYSTLVGGYSNTATGQAAAVIGGATQVAGGQNSFIGGGSTNTIASAASNSIVLGGSGNNNNASTNGVFSSTGCTIGAGAGANNVIIAGTSCTVTSGTSSLITGNTNTAAADWTLVTGKDATSSSKNEVVHGGGKFANNGDNQNSKIQLSAIASSANINYVLTSDLTGASTSNQIVIPLSTFCTIWGYVNVTDRYIANACSFKVEAVVKRGSSGAPTIVGTPTITAIGTVPSGWLVSLLIDSTNNAIQIVFNMGGTAMTLRVNAVMHVLKLSFP